MEELAIFLIVVVIPGLMLTGVILGIVALVKQRSLARRIGELERTGAADPAAALERRFGDLERRIGVLEAAGPAGEAVSQAAAEPRPARPNLTAPGQTSLDQP